ncbi:MAG: DinB family protein [Planctomycetales bacterium]|nr:DinB family protein [Planctomycetales bacterium]
MLRERLNVAIAEIEFARSYTHTLLDDLSDEAWLEIPAGGVSNIAWQVGHLAMAQYALTMIRIRGKEPTDSEFITSKFFKRYKKTSSPSADASANEPLDEIRKTFAAVHQQALKELPLCTDETLSETLPAPTAVTETKLGSIFFCSKHEMLHAGQIGMIRRMLGKDPVR